MTWRFEDLERVYDEWTYHEDPSPDTECEVLVSLDELGHDPLGFAESTRRTPGIEGLVQCSGRVSATIWFSYGVDFVDEVISAIWLGTGPPS